MRFRTRLVASLACAFAVALVFTVPRKERHRDEAGAPQLADAMQAVSLGRAMQHVAEVGVRQRDADVTRGDVDVAAASASAIRPLPADRWSASARQLGKPVDSGGSGTSDEANAPEREAQEHAHRTWPYFARVNASPGHVSTALRGVDPGAPRRLELWRVDGAPRRIATTVSNEAGDFDFGQQLLPLRGVELQVVPSERAGVQALDAPRASRVTLRFVAAGF